MFSGASFGEFGFSEQEFTLDTAFEAFLAEVGAERCWLLEIDAFSLATVGAISDAFSDAAFSEIGFSSDAGASAGGAATLYYSTHGFTSRATDTPVSAWYDARLTDDILIERRITGRDGIGGLARVFAEIALINQDGGLDTLADDYALDGRQARILIGRPTDARADYVPVFTGVVESIATTLAGVRLRLSDGMAKLELPVQTTTYAGSGGLEGGTDLKGKPKPLGWGKVFNIEPPLVDAANLIYQVRAGAIKDVPAAYDRGIALAKVGGAPAAGQYSVDTANGTFTLGATPAGTVTCDAELDASLSGYIDKTGDIVLRILTQQAALNSSEIEPSSFLQLNTDAPAPVGIWVGTEPRTIAEVVDELLAGVGAFGGFSRLGGFTVGLVAAASGEADASLSSEDITALEREPLAPAVEPVIWRSLVGYQKNYTVQNDLAAAVSAARRTFVAEAMRVAKAEDPAIQSRHLLAVIYGPVPALYRDQADAQTEVDRLLALWGAAPKAYLVTTRPKAMLRDLGDVVDITYPRYRFTQTRPARVLGHRIRGNEVELSVLV